MTAALASVKEGLRHWLFTSCMVAALLAPANASASALTFSAPESVAPGHALNAVACPSATFCIAVGSGGVAVTSADPAGGAGAWTPPEVIDGTRTLTAVACASANLCVATDNHSRVLSSTDPAGGAAAWHSALIDAGRQLDGISCPSAKLCVAVDRHGGVLSTTKPTGGPGGWKRVQVSKVDLSSISCPSTRLCVATEASKKVLVSTHPKKGRKAWRELKVAHGSFDQLLDVSCASAHLCAAVKYTNATDIDVLSAKNPTVKHSWHDRANLDSRPHVGAVWASVSCGSPHLCVAISGAAFGSPTVSVSTQPSSHDWSVDNFPGSDAYEHKLNAVACAGTSLCTIVTDDGSVIVGT